MRLPECLHKRIAALLLPVFLALFAPAASTQPVNAATNLQTPPPISGRNLAEPGTILPADVLARVELISANLELIRKFMGKTLPLTRRSWAGCWALFTGP